MKSASILTGMLLLTAYCHGQSSDSLFQRAKALELDWKPGEAAIIYDTLVQRGYRVDEIKAMKTYKIHRQVEERYLAERSVGDKAFLNSNLVEAREAYMRAWSLKPEDQHSKQRIEKIDELLGK